MDYKNEINTLEFNIERKINGEENWTTIGKKAAAGQSSNEQLYIYDDNIGSAGKVYYRIKQIDVNGSYTYTDIQSIIIKKNDRFSMEAYPNPVKGKLEIVFNSNTESNVRLEIYDILGRSVFNKGLQFRNGSNYLDLNMSEYTPGTYIVRVSSAEINESMTVVKVD
ncbi:MAG: T9SS type A sorting domain-containing protein [Saprospiraceae bacterium]|nr:T9SS type A sorting domain-containing protein [Saprospiraceae bacterium]